MALTPHERIAKANRARDLLESDDMGAVFREVREALITRLESSAMGDTATQHEIALTLQLLKQLRSHLKSWIDDGVLAEKEVQHENWLAKLRKRTA